jgi:hypothetical protein
VLPIPANALESSHAFRAFDRSLRESSPAGKIAWAFMAQRRDRLHATLCAGLSLGETAHVKVTGLMSLLELGKINARIGGPLIGKKNTGQIYFTVYPEERADSNCFHII